MSIANTMLSPLADRAANAVAPARDPLAEIEVPLAEQVRTAKHALAWKETRGRTFALVGGIAAGLLVCGLAFADTRRRGAAPKKE